MRGRGEHSISASFTYDGGHFSQVLAALRRDQRAGNLTVARGAPPGHAWPPRLRFAPHVLGTPTHSSKARSASARDSSTAASAKLPALDLDATRRLDRTVLDWAALAFAPRRVVALPSSFSASASCMFAPSRQYDVLDVTRAGTLRCDRPLASSAARPEVGGAKHPCHDLPRITQPGLT